MHTIAIVNQKGGCGKTTTAINLAAVLGQQDVRVLLIDMDPQGHASLGLGVAGDELPGLYELLKDEQRLDEIIRHDVARGVDLIPGNISLAATEHLLAEQPDRDRQLARRLAMLEGRYDCVVLPVEPSLYALDGIERLRETIHLLAGRYGIQPDICLLANMFNFRTRIARNLLEILETQLPIALCSTRIRNSVCVRDAACHGMPLTEHAPRAPVTGDFQALAQELLGSMLQRMRSHTADAVKGRGATPPGAEPVADSGRPQELRQSGNVPQQTCSIMADATDERANPTPAARPATDDAGKFKEVVFHFHNTGNKRVQIAGEFNNWVPDKNVKTELLDGSLQKTVRLKPGGYEYRLVIDGVWQADPANPEVTPNHMGEYNSLLHVRQ